ncbi:phosphoribosylanthranilate isomerase [Orenia metallireducens]|jgi:phosphoribosylanthranilate isomerase|uniref:N-(5'-phosphoribosyl)anthranilate isomerase n=1 Tax=Orenia metallireducens TaxID=1413210 RepID=A0A285HA68_9FIRM|nr:phosphoribosylanthranilate isomerase [Orenia metallireducens]PRX28938.1 phosphoribosylanthranilate isomerase [Orenia metallireducens]SNY32642.1 phosphoribosylanthranilate isomerase [Orenia metallireducens]
MTKVKICGITNLDDAKVAVEYGADYLGFIFAKSPRKVSPYKVKEIIEQLPEDVKKVGVFANQSLEEIAEVISSCSLDYLQLHGDESPEYCQEFNIPVIKVFRVKDESYLEQLKEYQVDKYLLDTYHPNKLGGVGKTFNWELAKLAKEYGEIIIAGGLNPANVKQAIDSVNPYGVDVSSGVEAQAGIKDKKRLEEFIRRVKK